MIHLVICDFHVPVDIFAEVNVSVSDCVNVYHRMNEDLFEVS